ncbi:MAG: hypothetical protein ACHQ6T_13960, partial [Myxococcota bacterium]
LRIAQISAILRPELSRAAVTCALALASALVPSPAARAGMGSLFDTLVCRDPTNVAPQFAFDSSFIGLAACQKLCLDATTTCVRDVKDAESCELAFASDWIAFDSKLDCAGLTGSELGDCRGGWALDKQTWQTQIKNVSRGARAGCVGHFSSCIRNCSGV